MKKISWILPASLSLGTILVDQLTKYASLIFIAKKKITPFFLSLEGIKVFKNFLGIDLYLDYVTNEGALWGFGRSWGKSLVALRIALILLTSMYLYFNWKSLIKIQRYAFVLILSGGVSNVIDHFVRGHVIDMIHFIFWGYSYPVFNLADVAICTGVLMILISLILPHVIRTQN